MSQPAMPIVEALNALNEKGIKYLAGTSEEGLTLAFGILATDLKADKPTVSKVKVEVVGQPEGLKVVLGNKATKQLNLEEFGVFVDQIKKLRALQEEEANLFAELIA